MKKPAYILIHPTLINSVVRVALGMPPQKVIVHFTGAK